MASTTALLRTQASRQQTIWNQEDQVMDYNWGLSDKSAEALAIYNQHYQDRMANPQADPTKAITYMGKINSANKAYTSNEIQRASIDIAEGNQPPEYKLQVLGNLYTQAYQNGDYDLAQSLRLQYDNAQMALQSQYAAASSAASSQYSSQASAILSDVKSGNYQIGMLNGLSINDISEVLKQDGPGKAYQLMAAYAGGEQNLDSVMNQMGIQTNGQPVSPITALYALASYGYAEANAYANAIQDPALKAEAISKVNAAMQTDTINVAGSKFTLTELADVANNVAAGTNKYSIVQTDKGLKINENPAIDYQVKFDENGNIIPTSNELFGTPNVYGTSATQATDLGYPAVNPATGKPYEVLYKWDNKAGTLAAIPFNEKNYDKSGNPKTVKDTVNKEQIIASSGFVKSANGNYYTATDPYLIKQMQDMGIDVQNLSSDNFIVDSTGHIKFRIGTGDIYQLVTYRGADNKPLTRAYKVEGGNLGTFMGGRQPSVSTTDVLGTQMLTNLQANVNGGAFQGGNMGLVQQTGTTGTLQRAASAQQLNSIQAQNLQVQNTPAPAITVQPYAPPAPIQVAQTVTQYPIKVATAQPAQPLVVQATPRPTLTGSMQGGGGMSLQGGSGWLQGSGNTFQGGTLRVQ